MGLSNIHKVRLGPSGYQGKVEKWRHDREVVIAAEKAWMNMVGSGFKQGSLR
jgi:hypothetical protein